jgi:hypothetical protein
MFPNPQEALPLPLRPNLEQYKKQAKDFVKACRSKDSDAIHDWARRWVEALAMLADLKIPPGLPVRLDRWVEEITNFARRHLGRSGSEETTCSLTDAQFVIARSHGFESWPRFVKHLEGLARASSSVSNFESAADAVVSGDLATLERLLREDPALARARSTREHRATLLHYVSANGVEGYRQKTAKNVVKVAELLLQAGAEVDARAEVYGGGATTLGLVATSLHPARAGVQEELMELLLRHGAAIDPPQTDSATVNACLANGRGRAAEFLAKRGARLNLEAAAGVGDLNVVKSFFQEDGVLRPSATRFQLERGFLWACEYGHKNLVEFLLQRGPDLGTQANTGQTALHWAVIGGQLEMIKLLLQHGASLEAKNAYGGSALGQALWSSVNGDPGIDHVSIIEALLDAGAKMEDGSLAWLARQAEGSFSVKQRVADALRRHGAKS